MKPFFQFFAERHTLANLITIMTILLGLSGFYSIRRDIWPQVDYGMMTITTRYPGASPEDVELNVTNKIEDELSGVTGIERMGSVSMENISVITVIIDPDASDQDQIMDDIREAAGRVTAFPEEVTESPLVTEIKTSIFPVVEVGVAGDLPYEELRAIAKRLETKLEAQSGVSGVRKYGYLAREIKVEVSPRAVQEYQIPMREIIGAVRARNIRSTAGSFESYTSEKNLVTLAQFEDPLEVGDVIVRSTFEGPAIKVKDLAVITDGFEDERVLSRMNGHPAISFEIKKKESADAIRTVDAVRTLMARESETFPDGVEVLYSNDFSTYVRKRLDVVQSNGLIGLALVLIMLSMFLSLRSAFWVAMGIPVTLLGVIFLLPAFNVYLDGISLASMIIVLGIIVDDGIIIAENVQKHRERGASPLKAAVDGIHEVFAPVVTTVMTTFLAFAPMFFMSGIMGEFVFVIPLVVSLALFISLFEAVVALPAHLTMGLGTSLNGKVKPVRRNWFHSLTGPFQRGLHRLLPFRYLFVLVFSGLLVLSLWYASNFMKFELFPAATSDKVMVLIELPTGSSLEATSDKVKEIEEIVASLPERELESYVTRIGSQEVWSAAGFPPGENENWAYLSVNLTPFAERNRTADEIVESLRGQTDRLTGYDKIVYSIEAGGPPVGKPITVRVVGPDDTLRTQLSDSLAAYLSSLGGIKDIDRNDKLGKEQIEIKIDYDKLSRLGLTVADVARSIRIAYDGEVVTSVRYGDEDVDFRILLNEETRKRPELLDDLLIPNQRGRLIPLRHAARLVSEPGPSNYYHFGEQRAVTVTADVTKGQITALEAVEKVRGQFDLSRDWPGMQLIIGGEADETEKSMNSLFRTFALALIGIYFLLILLFNSPTQPLIVVSTIPFGIMGVIAAFALHQEPMGFIAMLGVIGLVGVVVNDSLVLVNHINKLRKERPDEPMRQLVAQGTADRLRAVVLTSLTTVAGLLPLAYGIGGTDPYIAPMALALAYGLVFATPITMILVPSLYLISSDIGRLFSRRVKAGA